MSLGAVFAQASDTVSAAAAAEVLVEVAPGATAPEFEVELVEPEAPQPDTKAAVSATTARVTRRVDDDTRVVDMENSESK
jgi:hypothetical protein